MTDQIVSPEELNDAMEMLHGVPLIEIQPPSQQFVRDQEGGWHVAQGAAWVKFSTAFRDHMAELKGCKLAVFLCISLHVGSQGTARPGVRRICKLTGYESSAVTKAIRELEAVGGLLGITRQKGKTNVYRPAFVAYGRGSTPLEKRNTVPPKSETLVPPKSETKEELVKKNQEGELARHKNGRARDPLFDAICEICAVDPATSGASVGKVRATLLKANPSYTSDEVRRFGRAWWADDFHAKRGIAPTLWQLQERIGQVRAQAFAPSAPEPVAVRVYR